MKILKGGLRGSEAALEGSCNCNCVSGNVIETCDAGFEQGACACSCPGLLSNWEMEAGLWVWI